MEVEQSEIVCRACLSDNTFSYLDINETCYERMSFKDLIESLTSFVVEENEPSFVCELCAIQLEESYKFKKTLEDTQIILSQLKTKAYNEAVVQEIEVFTKQEIKIEEEIYDDFIEQVEETNEKMDTTIENTTEMKVVEVIGKDFTCMYCSKQFSKERGLYDHLQRYHRDKKSFGCIHCQKSFYSIEQCDAHASNCPAAKHKNDQILQCPECDRIGDQKLIKNHILNVHRKKREGPFQCDLCKLWLKSKECVTNHMKAKHLHRKFPCKYCNKSYRSRSGHDQHVQQYHTRDQTYICQLCPYKTHSKTLLRKHELRHTSTASFPCNICNSSFVSLDNLRRHQFVHTDARPCICKICNRGFKNKEALKKHQAIHQEYRYECPMCMRKYLTNQAMRNHATKNHANYKLPPLGTVTATDAKLKLTTEINAKLQKTITLSQDMFGTINYDESNL